MTITRDTILVAGATSAEGGSVVRHLIADGRWRVRAITRRPKGLPALALRRLGVEVVRADLLDPDSLVDALAGVTRAFGCIALRDDAPTELARGRNLLAALADAAQRAQLEHVVLSATAAAHRLAGGAPRDAYLDRVTRLEREARTLALPATFVDVALHYEHFATSFPPRRDADGTVYVTLPHGARLAAVSAQDVGGVVARLFADGTGHVGRTIGIVGDDRPAPEYAAALGRALGRHVAFRVVSRDRFLALGAPPSVADALDFAHRFATDSTNDLAETRRLYPMVRTFDAWLLNNARAFATALAS